MPTCPKQLLTGDEESSSKALKWRNRGSHSWSSHWHLKGQLNTQNLNWVKWLLNSLCSKCLLQNAKAKTNSPPWQIKLKFGWEAQLFTRGNTANNSSAFTTSLTITSFQAFPFWPVSTGRKITAGARGWARFTTHSGEFPKPLRGGSRRQDCLSAAALQLPVESGRHCCHLFCYLRWQGTSPRGREEEGQRCAPLPQSSSLEKKKGWV